MPPKKKASTKQSKKAAPKKATASSKQAAPAPSATTSVPASGSVAGGPASSTGYPAPLSNDWSQVLAPPPAPAPRTFKPSERIMSTLQAAPEATEKRPVEVVSASPVKANGKRSTQKDIAAAQPQLLQSLCLVERLLSLQRHGGMNRTWHVADEAFFFSLSETAGRPVAEEEFYRLARTLPSKLLVTQQGSQTAFKLEVDSIPSVDEVKRWIAEAQQQQQQQSSSTAGGAIAGAAQVRQSKRGREADTSSPSASAAAAPVSTTLNSSSSVGAGSSFMMGAPKLTHGAPSPLGPLTSSTGASNHPTQNSQLTAYAGLPLSNEKLSEIQRSVQAVEEAEKRSSFLDREKILSRVLPLYDLLKRIVPEGRRCFGLPRALQQCVNLNRFGDSKSEIRGQMKELVKFPSAGMSLFYPSPLFADDEGDVSSPTTAGGGGRGRAAAMEEAANVNEEDALLIIDWGVAARKALSEEVAAEQRAIRTATMAGASQLTGSSTDLPSAE